jgi:geranylgeranyl reductase family protein
MISIIGAGPVGSYTARLLAEQGKNVQLFEEHREPGRPVQCTGIVTKSLEEIVKLRKEFVVNKLKNVKIYAPNGESICLKTEDVVIDRAEFDKHLARKAEERGAKIFLNSRVEAIKSVGEYKKLKIYRKAEDNNKTKIVKSQTVIGADGPNSLVSRFLGNKKPKFWAGVQATVKTQTDKNTYSVYFEKKIPGFFGWVVPENEETARIGIATTRPIASFKKFVKKACNGEKYKIKEMQGGLIPKYNPNTLLEKNNVFVVGDAATQVKATTGGGLVPGLKAAECLSKSIMTGRRYERLLWGVNAQLRGSLLIRNTLDHFEEEDYNKLIQLIKNKPVENILNKESRDEPLKLLFKLLLKEPRLLLFGKVLCRAKCL